MHVKEVHDDDKEKNLDNEENDRVDHFRYESLVQRANHQLISAIIPYDFFCPRWVKPSTSSKWNVLVLVGSLRSVTSRPGSSC